MRRGVVRLAAVVMVISIAVGGAAGQNRATLGTLYKQLVKSHVDTLDGKKLIERAARAMAAQIDPYTTFLTEKEYQTRKQNRRGRYSGVGLGIDLDADTGIVVKVMPNSPAAMAGIVVGDRLVGVDRGAIEQKKVGDTIFLTVAPDKKCQLVVADYRTPVIEKSEMLAPQIGYVKFDEFRTGTADSLKVAIKALKEQGAKGLIVDLRGNGGGRVDETIAATSLFLPPGNVIATTKGRLKRYNSVYRSGRKGNDTTTRLVVLVDKNSASGAEMMVGALKDYGRATIVGEKTFGKGVGQVGVPMGTEQGAGYALITVFRYYTPRGVCFSISKGIEPHIKSDQAKATAIELIKKEL